MLATRQWKVCFARAVRRYLAGPSIELTRLDTCLDWGRPPNDCWTSESAVPRSSVPPFTCVCQWCPTEDAVVRQLLGWARDTSPEERLARPLARSAVFFPTVNASERAIRAPKRLPSSIQYPFKQACNGGLFYLFFLFVVYAGLGNSSNDWLISVLFLFEFVWRKHNCFTTVFFLFSRLQTYFAVLSLFVIFFIIQCVSFFFYT